MNLLISSRNPIGGLGAILLLVPFLIACSQDSTIGEVSGVITLDGTPLAGAIIFFKPNEGGTTAFGRTDDEGRYQLVATGSREGTVPGTNTVRITTRLESSGERGESYWTPEKVPARYNEESTLQAEVKPGRNELNFDLTSK